MSLSKSNNAETFDLNRFWELYEKADNERFRLLKERGDMILEIINLRMQLNELKRQATRNKAPRKQKGLLMKLNL